MALPKISKKRLETEKRREQILQMKLYGLRHNQIAKKLGISEVAVSKHVQQAYKKLQNRNDGLALELIMTEGLRLDRMHQSIWEAATKGGKTAIDQVLKIMERRAKLFGLDAPVKTAQTNIEGTETAWDKMTDEELMARLEELEAKT